jgi:hypothetical protein
MGEPSFVWPMGTTCWGRSLALVRFCLEQVQRIHTEGCLPRLHDRHGDRNFLCCGWYGGCRSRRLQIQCKACARRYARRRDCWVCRALSLDRCGTRTPIFRVLAICIAAEIAAARPDVHGPGTFLPALIDELANLTPEVIVARANVEVVESHEDIMEE